MGRDQFDAVLALTSLSPDAPATMGARLVKVEGMKGKDAAAKVGVSAPAVSKVVRQVERIMALAEAVMEAKRDYEARVA